MPRYRFDLFRRSIKIALKFSRYHQHKKPSPESPFAVGKKTYAEKRGIVWTPNNKRPIKLKDSIKELEVWSKIFDSLRSLKRFIR